MHLTAALLTAAFLLPTDALACGGFFCSNEFPIDQSAEQIVFGIDETRGEVEVHVGITYEGASEDFAWIVPTPALPVPFVSSDALFTAVDAATRPQFILQHEYNGTCDWWFGGDDLAMADGDPSGGVPEENGVTVISEEQVGPYQTVVLQATTSENLLTWLQGAGYDLPDNLGPVLAPYVAGGQYFIALKLSAGKDTGDLVPLGMRYPGTAASVPIQLTSIAATPDMRLEVYVLGDARAVPESYLHVTINEAAISWFDGGRNYEDVITMAADEAGGHAFATDFSGSTAPLRGRLWQGQDAQVDALRAAANPFAWMDGVMGLGLPPSAALLALFQEVIPFPDALATQGLAPGNFYDCLSCYAEHVDATNFDAGAATDLLEQKVIDGLREAERLFSMYPHLTRMTSSLDAIEMTVDPVFAYNRDLPQQVSNIHTATVTYDCGLGSATYEAPRRLELSDGREIRLPSQSWVAGREMTEIEVIGDLAFPAAILIERYGATGTGEVLFDFRDEAAREARKFRAGGCSGCDSNGVPSGGLAGLLALALVARRRG